MSTSATPEVHTFKAGADFTGKQYHLAVYGANKETLAIAGAGKGLFVILNEGKLGDLIEGAYAGGAKVKLGGTVAVGDRITADATGKAVVAASKEESIGFVNDAGVAGDIVGIYIDRTTIPVP